jgi:hypothetical protein
MLLPALGIVKTKVLKSRAKTEMTNIGNALSTYETTYSRLPILPGIVTGDTDVTFGINSNSLVGSAVIPANNVGNSNIIAVLMDTVKFRDNRDTANKGHALNPQSIIPLSSVKMASGSGGDAGVGLDGDYRDPWGHSYVISLDYNFDGQCRDALYSRKTVTRTAGQAGANGLFNTNTVTGGDSDQFEFNGKYLIWSRGPDGKFAVGSAYDRGDNRDNVLGWTQ